MAGLEVSVSFGKYENDAAVCWEKWSTFSPNKYLEEVGKCSTPGSVAQKKAFFEAHYKKIAAMKAEAEEQHTTQMKVCDCDEFEDESSSLLLQVLESPPSEPLNSSAAAKLEEAALVNVESMKLVQKHFQVELETADHPPQKINPKKEVKNSIGRKKKPASNKPNKTPEKPATRLSKPKETSTSSSVPSSSKKKLSETPMSLHLSMSMTVTSSRRPSLFMEQMGDKDIVKRAFKTFQNRVNQLPSSSDTGLKQLRTYQKQNERSRKAAAAEKVNPARGHLGPTWKSGSFGVDERAQERSERRKQFFKNLEEKSNARVASSKSKEVKDTEMKTIRQKAKGVLGNHSS